VEKSDIKKRIKISKYWDHIFAIVGLLSSFVGLVLLFTLFLDLFIDGFPRLTYKFFTSFPSRFPEEAGILSAWVGTALVMVVTALASILLGVAAGIYLEEYARKNWLMDIIEINIANLAGVPSIIYGLLALGFICIFL